MLEPLPRWATTTRPAAARASYRAAPSRCTRKRSRGTRNGGRLSRYRLAARRKPGPTAGWVRWNAVSKQATWGISGPRS